ncbi:hypothetical protein N2152v2_002444 [Parachlorella kessleri]
MVQQVRTHSVDTANGGSSFSHLDMEKQALLDRRLNLLTERLDAISHTMQSTSTGHFNRSLVAMTSAAGITESATQFIAFALGIIFGGATMILVALLEVVRRNALGTAAFGTFGSFWLSAGLYSILQAQGVFFLQAKHGMQAIFALFGIAAISFMVISVAICLALPFLFLNIGIMFFLLAGGVESPICQKVAGWWGIWTSALALYEGVSFLFEDVWGKEILPQFYTKPYRKHAVVLWPKISTSDTLAATAGYPKPGPFTAANESNEHQFRTPSLIPARTVVAEV